MLTINIESNKTPPFVESNQLVVFNVIDNNQESHQITSRVVQDRKSTRLNSSHVKRSRMPSSA